MKSEDKLHDWLKQKLMPCDYCRIEGSFPGIPDVSVAKEGTDKWCELKVYTKGRVLLRKEQYAWMMRRDHYRPNSCFVIAWHEGVDLIHVWIVNPDLVVIPYGEYLQITSNPYFDFHKDNCPIKTILFLK